VAQAQLPYGVKYKEFKGWPATGPISLGPIDTPMHYIGWDQRCLLALGRIVEFELAAGQAIVTSEKLTDEELWALGFKAAATGYNIYEKLRHKQ
jgi:hypothetical protein